MYIPQNVRSTVRVNLIFLFVWKLSVFTSCWSENYKGRNWWKTI